VSILNAAKRPFELQQTLQAHLKGHANEHRLAGIVEFLHPR
jgi:hypothetical protein